MGNSLGSRPKDVAGRYESQLKDPQSKVGKLVLENDVPKSAVSFQPPPQNIKSRRRILNERGRRSTSRGFAGSWGFRGGVSTSSPGKG